MTSTGEFKTVQGTETEEKSNSSQIFGITMTPLIGGVLLGLLGLGVFWYIWTNMLNPVIESKKTLEGDKETKAGQLQQLQSGEVDKKLAEVQAELEKEKQLEPQVLAMFSDEQTLDTILLDLYSFIQANQVQLVSFQPDPAGTVVIADGSLGTLVNNRLKKKTNTLTIIGTFEQTKAVIQDIERLQPLLLIRDFDTQVTQSPKYIYKQGQISTEGEILLTSTFKIDAILPENPANIPQPAAAPPAQGAPTP